MTGKNDIKKRNSLAEVRFLYVCGLRPHMEWQGSTFEDTDLATLAHLEATATLRSPNTIKNRTKVNFLLIFLCLCFFFCTFAG